jgi:hypothetical protein
VAAPETIAGDLPWLPLSKVTVLDPVIHWVPEPWSDLDTELAAAPFGPASDAQGSSWGGRAGPRSGRRSWRGCRTWRDRHHDPRG